MVDCKVFRPHHQNQLRQEVGGRYGGVNCTACAAAMVAEAALCGPKFVVLGKQVRRASNERVPDKDSPGLTLRQVADALEKLTDGEVVLTVRQPIRFSRLRRRLLRGQVAVLQVHRGVFIDQGFGFGKTFRGGHAVTIGFDRDTLWVDDPLGRGQQGRHKFLPTWPQLAAAAAALQLGEERVVGNGRAWAAFADRGMRRLRGRQTVRISPGPILRYRLRGGRIFERTPIQVEEPITAECSDPARFPTHPFGAWADRRGQELIVMRSGPPLVAGFGFRETARTLTFTDSETDPELEPEATDAPPDVSQPEADAIPYADVTSPEAPDEPQALGQLTPEDLSQLEHEADEEPAVDVRNGDVGEPLLPSGTDDPEEDPELLGAGEAMRRPKPSRGGYRR